MSVEKDYSYMIQLLCNIQGTSHKISMLTNTNKTKGENYPIGVGYSNQVKRPFRDLMRWMCDVEEILEILIQRSYPD